MPMVIYYVQLEVSDTGRGISLTEALTSGLSVLGTP
jgi:hypothetical protein